MKLATSMFCLAVVLCLAGVAPAGNVLVNSGFTGTLSPWNNPSNAWELYNDQAGLPVGNFTQDLWQQAAGDADANPDQVAVSFDYDLFSDVDTLGLPPGTLYAGLYGRDGSAFVAGNYTTGTLVKSWPTLQGTGSVSETVAVGNDFDYYMLLFRAEVPDATVPGFVSEPEFTFSYAAVDNAEMDYVVPEPVTMALFGLGGLALLRRRHRA